ncbi:hypothetical protein AN9453.2 [Aspergillus nidulans FGSC A4]|nr:hypothetical protein AN9453.2 [Aspergillus nidulans FGSC A4]
MNIRRIVLVFRETYMSLEAAIF